MKVPFSVSVVMPAFNEAENLPGAVDECVEILKETADKYEVIVVDDSSTDSTQEVLSSLQKLYPCLKVICNKENIGCHPSCLEGFKVASGEVFVFLPADRQIPSNNITSFLSKFPTYDLVCSYRYKRIDIFLRRLASTIYNLMLRICFGINLHDTHSAIAVKKSLVEGIIHKIKSNSAFSGCEFILRAITQGFKITEIEIEHLPRVKGKAKGANMRDAIWTPVNLIRFWFELRIMSFLHKDELVKDRRSIVKT